MDGRRQAFELREEERLSLAYSVESLARHKRLPTLEKLLGQVRRGRLPPQTADDMLEVLRSIDNGRGIMDIKFVPHSGETEG